MRAFRPPRYADVIGAHLPWAALSGAVIALAHLPRLVAHVAMPCLFLRLTGYPCLFCGATRSFLAMAAGDWHGAFRNNPLAAGLYLLMCGIFAWNAAGLLMGVRIERGEMLRPPVRTRVLLSAGATALVLNWLYRVLSGLR